MERRYNPRIPWKRKSFIPGTLLLIGVEFSEVNSEDSSYVFDLPGKPVAHLAGDGGGGGV